MSDEQITLSEVEWSRAWNVRGDAAQPTFKLEAERLLGVALPLRSNATTRSNATAHDGGTLALWSGPGSWLVVAGIDAVQLDFDAARVALNAAGGALFDVSASYVAWKISGVNAARVLNRTCPLDFHPRVFTAGGCAQSVLGHVNAVFYRPRETPEFVVVVGRSFAADAWHALCQSAETDGYRAGPRSALVAPVG